MKRQDFFAKIMKWLAYIGFAFLYAPIIILVIYSFNSSKLVTNWESFSLKWYFALFADEQIAAAAITSLRIAIVSASLAVIFGTLAGIAMARLSIFRGRAIFSALLAAPMILPEVIVGLAFLLLFISTNHLIGFPSRRGFMTIIIAHSTIAIAYVAVLIQSRMASFDKKLEEAAADLGAKKMDSFFSITLPLIMPAVISGWLLAFTISFDDLVTTNFVTGPGATTLPMLIYSKVRLGVNPTINALATLILVIVVLTTSVAVNLTLKNKNKSN